jgi:flagellar hook-basal body complex protein FliE
MPDPLRINGLGPGQPLGPVGQTGGAGAAGQTAGPSFREVLLDSLEQVNRLQQEATDGVEKLMTGRTNNLDEVFSAVRKSEVAFGMLMEMRNKLIDAWREIQQMRM